MRHSTRPAARPSALLLLASAALLLSNAVQVAAIAKPAALAPVNMHLLEDSEAVDYRFGSLMQRADCANSCGYKGWLCCAADAACYTDANNQAGCGAAATQAAQTTGYWEYFTSVWTETDTVTKTAVYSSWIGASAAATPTGSCAIPCGSNCCGSGQYCLIWASGTCANQGTTPGAGATGAAQTTTIRPTTTVPFQSAVPTGQNVTVTAGASSGLSGGAIAGIVIGVLAAIILLILICLFCCARALFDSVLAIFGLGKKRRHTHEETYIEEHHHHSGGVAGSGRWYGHDRPSRPAKEKKSGGLGGLAGVGAALGGLALVLGLKRRHDRRHDEKSDYGSTYYSSDYTSSSSASSSDRHTRHTRDSRHTRDTRRSSRR